jgi:SARP family transcriptional regulator, regulator of embCAB operon
LAAPAGPLRIYLAGNVALERGVVLLPERALPGRQGRLALALLVAERRAALSVETIADVMWSGAPPPSWTTALRAIISKIRSLMAEHGLADAVAIESAFGCYQLRLPSDTWIDIEVAAKAVHDAETELRAGNLTAANGEALVAAAISRRPFLAGDEGDWVAQWRETLRGVRVRALSCRAEVAIASGDPAPAVRDAELVIELEPYRESAYTLLMRAYAASGGRAQALQTYDRLRTLMADQLGASPSPVSEATYLEILRTP